MWSIGAFGQDRDSSRVAPPSMNSSLSNILSRKRSTLTLIPFVSLNRPEVLARSGVSSRTEVYPRSKM